jgi:hypothetical protein
MYWTKRDPGLDVGAALPRREFLQKLSGAGEDHHKLVNLLVLETVDKSPLPRRELMRRGGSDRPGGERRSSGRLETRLIIS